MQNPMSRIEYTVHVRGHRFLRSDTEIRDVDPLFAGVKHVHRCGREYDSRILERKITSSFHEENDSRNEGQCLA